MSEESFGPPEMMAVALARLLRNGETVFHGVASPLPMVATLLAKRLHAPDLVYLSIAGGVDASPSRLPASTVDPVLLEGARATVTLAELFDLSARGRLDVAFLSGVQIDGRGRVNMSAIGPFARPTVRLPGGAGSALLMPTAKRVLLWRAKHDPRVFVDELDFVTAAGNVERVVTPLCVFRRAEDRLVVETIHPGVSPDVVRVETGFPVEVGSKTPVTAPPTPEELAVLEELDPGRVRASEF
ncbi:MAG: 3-oxoadipate CoA-transferase subunit B [uncultured Thermomicrobiales bacterium]|uniref:3-oxoadipate CoA-transferase subunit B n=1 Tax=uncultured Thermomicrobiales bacterium TaxID=1645740 RepID=A0A6J4UET0_9BACT|nr:MAG: 3-oxoadipate CoA-transferase subunit B [uncultured Thermomicrobiales bacterium]